jgi:DNA-binding NarL/FixJ family response regulator
MTYHAQPTKIPNLTCLVIPGTGKDLDSSASLSCGGSNGYYRAPNGILTASDMSGGLTCFTSADVSYIGLTQSISLSPNNPDYTLAVMMLKSDYDKAISRNNLQNFFLWALIIFFGVTSCLYFTKRFLSPILKALEQLKTQEPPQQTNVLEMDDLFDFLSQKDQEQERVVRSLERRRQAALRDKENLRLEYEAAQSRYEAAQQEVSRLAYSRSQEVDPDDYAQFLSGINTLTPTEHKIFSLYLEGKTVKEIIELSNFKESTLRFHNRNIYSKLGVNSLKQLLRFAALMQEDAERKDHK